MKRNRPCGPEGRRSRHHADRARGLSSHRQRQVIMVASGCAIGPRNRWRRRMSVTPPAIHTVVPA